MRTQYHSRQISGRRLIWDVHRLVQLTQHYAVKQIPLSNIAELDEPFWFDGDTTPTCRNIAQHAKLINEIDLAYPIILAADGRVMDGMHRVCKALIEGKSTISAVQFQRDPEPDYVDVNVDALPYDEG